MKTIQIYTNQIRVMGEEGNKILAVVVANEREMNEVVLGLMILLGFNCTITDQRSEPEKIEHNYNFIDRAPYMINGVKCKWYQEQDQFISANGVPYSKANYYNRIENDKTNLQNW